MPSFLKDLFNSITSFFTTHDIRQDSFMISTFIVLALLVFGQTVLLGIFYFDFPEVIVIHSNIYFGIDLIGSRFYSIFIPVAALLISTLHSAVMVWLYKHDRELTRLLMGGTLVVVSLLFANVILLVNLNT